MSNGKILATEAFSNIPEVNESAVNEVLNKELAEFNKKSLYLMMIRLVFKQFIIFPFILIGH